MGRKLYAVLMGFDKFQDKGNFPDLKFAEKDAKDFYDLITRDQFGEFSSKHITLITESDLRLDSCTSGISNWQLAQSTGNVTEAVLNSKKILEILDAQFLSHPVTEDVVLFYYSGYGLIAGDHQKSYLATPDLSVLDLLKDPGVGLEIDYLLSHIFTQTRAKSGIFILDCCHIGAFCPSVKGNGNNGHQKLVEERFFSKVGRTALVSTPYESRSRETDEFQNGIFTYYLLNGLRGEAVDPKSGAVNMASLVSYVQAMIPIHHPSFIYGRPSRLSFTRSGMLKKDFKKAFEMHRAATQAPVNSQCLLCDSLTNPMENQVEYIDKLLNSIQVTWAKETFPVGNRILTAIQRSLGAEFAFVLRVVGNEQDRKVIYKFQSDFAIKHASLDRYKNWALDDVYLLMTQPQAGLSSRQYGFFKTCTICGSSGKYTVVIPLHLEYPREFFVICGVEASQLQYGEILGCVLKSLYKASNELTSFPLARIETVILDDLKRNFIHLPLKLYTRRFTKFKEELARITFSYEPIIYLGRRDLEIDSWEALARDPETQKVPQDLFWAAELWGSEYITELDLYCLQTALLDYVQTWRRERGNQKIDPVSVNVYPETLYQPAYKRELTRIIKEEEYLKSKKLILEISEKQPLSSDGHQHDRCTTVNDSLDDFVKKILEYTHELRIGFAIDDFGVEHSSIARLARLELDHVKIDRDILHHTHPDSTFRYVLELVTRSHTHPIKVVVEGFDGDCKLSLAELYRLGIQYVQGHLIRRASTSVRDLDQEQKDFLTRQLMLG